MQFRQKFKSYSIDPLHWFDFPLPQSCDPERHSNCANMVNALFLQMTISANAMDCWSRDVTTQKGGFYNVWGVAIENPELQLFKRFLLLIAFAVWGIFGRREFSGFFEGVCQSSSSRYKSDKVIVLFETSIWTKNFPLQMFLYFHDLFSDNEQ